MKRVKKITLSGMMCALGTVILLLGSLFQTIDLTVVAIASFLVVFIHIELGPPYSFLVWICTSLLALLLLPSKGVGVEYAMFGGLYPILKDYFERLPRVFWIIVKLVSFNLLLCGMILVVEFVLGIGFFGTDSIWWKVGLYVLMNVAFFVYDLLITKVVVLYNLKYRDRVRKYLK